jgi:hypothetical protein
MQPISYARHQFPPEIIRHPVWFYLRFTLSCRDVEELLAEQCPAQPTRSGATSLPISSGAQGLCRTTLLHHLSQIAIAEG